VEAFTASKFSKGKRKERINDANNSFLEKFARSFAWKIAFSFLFCLLIPQSWPRSLKRHSRALSVRSAQPETDSRRRDTGRSMNPRDTVLTTLFHVTDSLRRNVITFLSVHSIKALPLMNACKWFARNKSTGTQQGRAASTRSFS